MIKFELSGFYCGVSTRDSYLLLDDVLDFCILIYLYDASLASRPLATYILNKCTFNSVLLIRVNDRLKGQCNVGSVRFERHFIEFQLATLFNTLSDSIWRACVL